MVLVALLLAACGEPSAGTGDQAPVELRALTLRTDRVEYSAAALGEGIYRTYRVMVVARLTNRSSQTVYLERCYPDWSYPIYGVETVGSDQDAAYDPAWGCVGHDHPIVVTAGETRTDSLQLTGPNMWDGHTHIPLGTLIGRFRLSYPLRMCPGEDDCSLSQVSVSSNDFEVRLAP